MPPKKTQITPVRNIGDNPASDQSFYGFDAYAETLAGLIANKENTTPLVMGIHGNRGTGKTSLMKAVWARLDGGALDNPKDYRYCKTIWFNAWKHEGKDELLAPLVESVFKAMDADGFFSLAKSKMDGLTKRIDQSKIFTSVKQLGAGADISEFFSDLVYKEKLGDYDTFQKFLNDLVWTFLYWRFKLTEEENPDDKKAALVIFVDDLDQCTRPHIVNVLETIKRFMVRTGWIFVLGSSKEALEVALAEKYGGAAARHVLEKILQVGFKIPQISTEAFTAYAKAIGGGDPVLMESLPMLVPGLGHNPRRLKRFINNMHLVQGLVRNTRGDVGFDKVLLWGLIHYTHPELALYIETHSPNFEVLQKGIKKLNVRFGDTPVWQLTEAQLKQEKIPHALRVHLQNPSLAKMLVAFDITTEQFSTLQKSYAAIDTDSIKPISSDRKSTPTLEMDPMTPVASGPFLFGEKNSTAVIDTPFEIDIYLVTRVRYVRFMESGGYTNQTWWSQDGWQWRVDAAVDCPAGWDDALSHLWHHPVVGVSWYEAEAYARWAGRALPSEHQWERAARGTDGWQYPWGNDFDGYRCNTSEADGNQTSPADRYSNGVSPEGCYDMAGNIWEWTASTAGDRQKAYAVKGGSWCDTAETARSAGRKGLAPEWRHPCVGFRCVRQQSPHRP